DRDANQERLPRAGPESVAAATPLIALAMQLVHSVPVARLEAGADGSEASASRARDGQPGRREANTSGGRGDLPERGGADALGERGGDAADPGKAIVLADYLLFAAVERLTELGPGSVGLVAALLERLAEPADAAALAQSTALAEFARGVG